MSVYEKIDNLNKNLRFVSHELNNAYNGLNLNLEYETMKNEKFQEVYTVSNYLNYFLGLFERSRDQLNNCEKDLKNENKAKSVLNEFKAKKTSIINMTLYGLRLIELKYKELNVNDKEFDESFNFSVHRIEDILYHEIKHSPKKNTFNDLMIDYKSKVNLKNIKLEEIVNGNTELFIDSLNFSYVLANLTNNSIRAIEKKPGVSGLIKITLEDAKDYFLLKHEDNGCGMSKERASKLFIEVYSDKTESGPHGLGTQIVNTIVKNHKGSIKAESVKGKGTSIIIKIPKLKSNK